MEKAKKVFNGMRRIRGRIGLIAMKKKQEKKEKAEFSRRSLFPVETMHTLFILEKLHLCFLEIMVLIN